MSNIIEPNKLLLELHEFFGDSLGFEVIKDEHGKSGLRGWRIIPDRSLTAEIIQWAQRNETAVKTGYMETDDAEQLRLIPNKGMGRPVFDLWLYEKGDEEDGTYGPGWQLVRAYDWTGDGSAARAHSMTYLDTIIYHIQHDFMECLAFSPPEHSLDDMRVILLQLLAAEVKVDLGDDARKRQVFYTMRILHKFFLYHICSMETSKEQEQHLESLILKEYDDLGIESYSAQLAHIAACKAVAARLRS